jgi:anaerobic selenocysteine-containing dehydrogenase
VAGEDLATRGLKDGDRVRVRSSAGTFEGRVRVAEMKAGNVQGYWPEVNVLLPHGPHDEGSGVPDYGAEVTIEAIEPGEGR